VNKDKIIKLKKPGFIDSLTELLREGARKWVVQAVESEFEGFLAEVKVCLEDGRPRVVQWILAPERDINESRTGIDPNIPRVRDRSGEKEKHRFQSRLIPPYMRQTATLDKVLPLLYLKGISEADFVEVLSPIFREQAKNLSPSVISRLKASWEME
jgi:putative transposase